MSDEWELAQNVITAGVGLVGVWLGGRWTWKREEERERGREMKEATYLAILVIAYLDRLANACLSVAFDDGTDEGRPAGSQGCWAPTVTPPIFDPLSFDVNWKSLPSDLMYDILGMPYRIEQLGQELINIYEYDSPPDYSEYFWARQHGWAVLGLEVSELAQRLRAHASLPDRPQKAGAWNRDDQMRGQRDKIEREKNAWEAQRANLEQ